MFSRFCILALVVTLAAPAWSFAEQVRFRYAPLPVPIGPEGTLGELKRGLGVRPLPYPSAPTPTQIVTFRHPFNGKNVTIPLRLPDDPARMMQRRDAIIYNYGDYSITVQFLTDGAVDVIYNSGLLRPLPF